MVGTHSGIRLPRSRPFVGQANKCVPFNPDRFSEEKSKELGVQRLGLPPSHCLENAIPPIAPSRGDVDLLNQNTRIGRRSDKVTS